MFQAVSGTSKEAPREAKSATAHIGGGSSVVILEPWWRSWVSWEIPRSDEHAKPTAIGFILEHFGGILEVIWINFGSWKVFSKRILEKVKNLEKTREFTAKSRVRRVRNS